jgi:preprotein translocase subunit SecY
MGAVYVSAVCVLPTVLVQRFNVPFYFGGTALLIVVGVALDTFAQIQTHLLARNYEGFMARGRVKSGRTRKQGRVARPADPEGASPGV